MHCNVFNMLYVIKYAKLCTGSLIVSLVGFVIKKYDNWHFFIFQGFKLHDFANPQLNLYVGFKD